MPKLPTVARLAAWLPEIFPEGTPNRGYLTREISAKTIFVMLYVGAVEGRAQWIRPDQVTRMTDRQAAKTSDEARARWASLSLGSQGVTGAAKRWYAANTREPIRDETLRGGLVSVGAVIERTDLPTTSSKPRYALASHFAKLLDSLETGQDASTCIAAWQKRHFGREALARVALLRGAMTELSADKRILATLPGGSVRSLRPGPSSAIAKAVIEDFSTRFLRQPAVVFVSESADKAADADVQLAAALGLNVNTQKLLPDLVLYDADPERPRLVFVEAVATDGAITEARKAALLQLATRAGHNPVNVRFVTAFTDRSAPPFRKLVSELAWGSHAWFVSEPDRIIAFRAGSVPELNDEL